MDRGITVWVDGNLIGTINDDSLSKGAELRLDDGSLLYIKNNFIINWIITLDGQPAIGSWDDLHARIKLISKWIIDLSGAGFILGIIGILIDSNLSTGSYVINDTIVWGGINLLFGILIGRGSLTAVIVAFIFNTFMLVILRLFFHEYYHPTSLNVFLNVGYLIFLILGFITIIKLKKAK